MRQKRASYDGHHLLQHSITNGSVTIDRYSRSPSSVITRLTLPPNKASRESLLMNPYKEQQQEKCLRL